MSGPIVIRWIGILDAAAMAAATAVGQAEPSLQPTIAVIVIALGSLSTVVAAVSKLLNPTVPAPVVGGAVSQ
jgi:hypothetical protein